MVSTLALLVQILGNFKGVSDYLENAIAVTIRSLGNIYSWTHQFYYCHLRKMGKGTYKRKKLPNFGCVCLIKWHQYIFSVSLKFRAYYITGQWGEFINKWYLMLLYTFLAFFAVFYHKMCVFIIFVSFFDEVSNFLNMILTNQKRELVGFPVVSGTVCFRNIPECFSLTLI